MSVKNHKTLTNENQMLISGMLTEKDIFRAVMRRLGHRGGVKRTPAQTAARRKNIKKCTQIRLERLRQK